MAKRPERTHLFQKGGPRPVQPRSMASLLVLLAIVVVSILLLLRLGGRDGVPQLMGPDLDSDSLVAARAAAATMADLERAVTGVELVAARLPASDTTAAAFADRLVQELESRGGTVGFVIGRPTRAWQVALVPVEGDRLVRVEGYASDFQLPALVAEVPVR